VTDKPGGQPAQTALLLDAVAAIGRERAPDGVLRRVVRLGSDLLAAPLSLASWVRHPGSEAITVSVGAEGIGHSEWLDDHSRTPLRTTVAAGTDPMLDVLGAAKVAVLRVPLPPPGTGVLLVARPLDDSDQFTDDEETILTALAAQGAAALSAVQFDAERLRFEDELRTAERLKTEFVAMTSHELRTPLTSIRAAVSMIRSYWDTVSEDRKMRLLEVIEGQSQRLSRLVENILAAANLEAGVVLPRITTVDMVAAAEEVARDFAAEIDVAIDVERPLFAMADPDHTRQILVNFVGNSLKYGAPPISITARRREHAVEIRVTDEGAGVPAEFVPRLFDRFTQASGGDTRHASGSGLGLSIVKGLAEACDGRVHYAPNDPRGACFILTLPAADEPA
jgi:signal transduction histidine kinase